MPFTPVPRRPPSLGRGWPLLGALPQFRKNSPEFLRSASRHGDLVHFRLGRLNAYLLNHPDWIRDVLVTHQSNFIKSKMLERARILLGDGLLTSEGEFHLRQRRLVQPAFHRDRLIGYAATMVECAAIHREQWQAGATLDMAQEMMRLTLAIVGRTLFSADVSSQADEIGGALTEVFGLLETLLMPFSEWIEKLPIPVVKRFERARDRLNQVIYGLIAQRRLEGVDRGDLLSMLLLAQDEESNAQMTDRQVRDEALTLMLAGHETTSNALTWTWYLLSQNPEAEAKLHAEIGEVLGDRLPSLVDLPKLPYTGAVFSEALRLYPPAWAVGRRPKQDYPVGGYVIPAGSIVLLSPWVVQRDPRWFPEPEKFDPDRWIAETDGARGAYDADPLQPAADRVPFVESGLRPKFSYFPFGGGARVCIGERFAGMEGVLVLATLAQRWRPRLVPGHRVETSALITLRTKYGMRMTMEPR